jgi:hypothetical protein
MVVGLLFGHASASRTDVIYPFSSTQEAPFQAASIAVLALLSRCKPMLSQSRNGSHNLSNTGLVSLLGEVRPSPTPLLMQPEVRVAAGACLTRYAVTEGERFRCQPPTRPTNPILPKIKGGRVHPGKKIVACSRPRV